MKEEGGGSNKVSGLTRGSSFGTFLEPDSCDVTVKLSNLDFALNTFGSIV